MLMSFCQPLVQQVFCHVLQHLWKCSRTPKPRNTWWCTVSVLQLLMCMMLCNDIYQCPSVTTNYCKEYTRPTLLYLLTLSSCDTYTFVAKIVKDICGHCQSWCQNMIWLTYLRVSKMRNEAYVLCLACVLQSHHRFVLQSNGQSLQTKTASQGHRELMIMCQDDITIFCRLELQKGYFVLQTALWRLKHHWSCLGLWQRQCQ